RRRSSKPMWSRTRPRVGACAVSTLANRSEGRQILHVEADVVEDAPAGRSLRRIDFGEPELAARNVDDRLVIARPDLAAEGFRVPGYGFGDLRFQQEEVHVLMLDGNGLGLVFEGIPE